MTTTPNAPKKDAVSETVADAALSVEFIPVPGQNQPQQMSVNTMIAALGGEYKPVKGGDEIPKLEGWVPPTNRNGKTFLEDPSLGHEKTFIMRAVSTGGETGDFPNNLDPRDNDAAPDEWEDKSSARPVAKK